MSESFKGYGKLDDYEQARLEARRKTRKRIIVVGLSSIVLVAVIVGAVVGTSNAGGKSNNNDDGNALAVSVKAVCDVTLYKDSCMNTLSPMIDSKDVTPQQILKLSIQAAIDQLMKESEKFAGKGAFKDVTDNNSTAALQSCQELLDLALDHLNKSLSASDVSVPEAFDDLKTWLSTAITDYDTCIDGFQNTTEATQTSVQGQLQNSTELASNSLAIVTWLSKLTNLVPLRRLMSVPQEPEWLHPEVRKLLATPSLKSRAHMIVAKDGSSKYKTIGAALKAVPDKSKTRTIIYVKSGVYNENVRVEKPKWNVLVVGDGMGKTVVSASLNVVDGTPTFQSATFAVFGQGFIATDITFRNTAGPAKHQAVAMMSTADQSVFYRCSFDAYQDTLYAHSNRQFYRDCIIYGTVDFIFGNSAVVLQNCAVRPKKPMQGQQNTITAQGKVDPNQNTGIVFQGCNINGGRELAGVQTYLGRPWKAYSTTVYMQSFMGSLIDPKGWLPWVGNSAPSTIYYAEYSNNGPGSSTTNRVKWTGLRFISIRDAWRFTVKPFLQGDRWIPASGAPFKAGF